MGKRRRNRRRQMHCAAADQTQQAPVQGEGEQASASLQIREAGAEDVDQVFDFLLHVAPQSGRLLAPIDAEKSRREVARVVGEPGYGYALLAFAGDALIGSIGVIYVDWWYSAECFFAERWFFADPAHREAGAALLAEADAIATSVGAPLIVDLRQRRKRNSAVVFVQQQVLTADA